MVKPSAANSSSAGQSGSRLCDVVDGMRKQGGSIRESRLETLGGYAEFDRSRPSPNTLTRSAWRPT